MDKTTKNCFLTTNNLCLDQFIDYWDKVISDWFGGTIDKDQLAYGNHLVNEEYMPEPYIGNPKKCSFVVVNYNAGGGDSRDPHNYRQCANCNIDRKRLICYVKDHCYSEFELPFPCLMDDKELLRRHWEWIKDYSGFKWWQQKKNWVNNVTKAAGVPSIKDGVMPFAIDLCGWHSKSWSNTKDIIDNDELKEVVRKYVIDVIKAAIDCSYAKFAYFIGKIHIPLLKEYGFEWKAGDNPQKPNNGKTRFFAVYMHPVTKHKVIVTWTIGSNTHPGKNYFDKEAITIQSLKDIY